MQLQPKQHTPLYTRLYVLMIVCLWLVACVGSSPHKLAHVVHAPVAKDRLSSDRGSYLVQAGDTLYSIAFGYHSDIQTLASLNHLKQPYQLSVGQRLRLPRLATVVNKKATKVLKTTFIDRPPLVLKHIKTASRHFTRDKVLSKLAVYPKNTTTFKLLGVKKKPLTWYWPLQGEHILPDGEYLTPRGLDICKPSLSRYKVKATASGEVVYVGQGVKNYGHLVLLKHGSNLISAYGFNRHVYVKLGQHVKAGQVIADLGKNLKQQPCVHFEVRHLGKVVPFHL